MNTLQYGSYDLELNDYEEFQYPIRHGNRNNRRKSRHMEDDLPRSKSRNRRGERQMDYDY